MQDCYELLNVNKAHILKNMIENGWNEVNVDLYIKSCYDKTVRRKVEIPRKVAIDSIQDELELMERLETLEQKQKLYDEAYEIIGKAKGRANYAETAYLNEEAHFARIKNAEIQEEFNQLKDQANEIEQEERKKKETQINRYAEFRERYQQRTKRPPYTVLNIEEESFGKLSFKEKIQMLMDKKEVLLKNYSSILNQSQDSIGRAEISIKMNEVAEAYEEAKRQVEEKRYDHTSEYQPDLIKGMIENNSSIENKIVIRQKNKDTGNPKVVDENTGEVVDRSREKTIDENMYNGERHISDSKRRNLRVKTIAKIGYQNSNNEKKFLYEYQVTRRINGEDKSDIVISPVSIVDILLDKRIGKDGSIDLYNFLADELFSEETIKGAQKNSGFIGSIKQDEEGNYYLTLDQNQLDLEEQEMLAATMIAREKERQKNEEGR